MNLAGIPGSAWFGLLALLALSAALTGCRKTIDEGHLFFPQTFPLPPESPDRDRLTVTIDDTTHLHGWRFTPAAPPRGRLLYFYGNGETTRTSEHRLRWLSNQFQLQTLCVDYRGYGASGGTPGVEALLDDAVRCYDQLLTNPDDSLPILIFGRSIGTGPAIHLAAERPVDALLLEAPFTSIDDVITAWSKRIKPPVRWVVRLKPAPALSALSPQPLDRMHGFTRPLFVLHGDVDEIIPLPLGRRMYEAAPSEDKIWCEVPGIGHNNLSLAHPDVEPALREFLERQLGGE